MLDSQDRWRPGACRDGARCPGTPSPFAREVFNLKSCVMAIPMEAKASDVRSQARKVLSGNSDYSQHGRFMTQGTDVGALPLPNAK